MIIYGNFGQWEPTLGQVRRRLAYGFAWTEATAEAWRRIRQNDKAGGDYSMMGHYAILSSPELRVMGLAALILSGFVSAAATAAELPKEGAFATTTYFHDSYDAVEAAPKSYMWTYDDYGIVTNDSGSGFMHNMVIHCKGTGANTNNAGGKHNVDHCVLVDSDGDRIETATENADSRSSEPPKGEATFLSGSGKYAGIGGKFEYTIDFLPRLTKDLSSQGNLLFISREKGSYKISGATQ
jgi:hypothetical protein